jgi:hypothetical protein
MKTSPIRAMPDWLRDALNGKAGTQIVPLNKAAGAKRNLSVGEINDLIFSEQINALVADGKASHYPRRTTAS